MPPGRKSSFGRLDRVESALLWLRRSGFQAACATTPSPCVGEAAPAIAQRRKRFAILLGTFHAIDLAYQAAQRRNALLGVSVVRGVAREVVVRHLEQSREVRRVWCLLRQPPTIGHAHDLGVSIVAELGDSRKLAMGCLDSDEV